MLSFTDPQPIAQVLALSCYLVLLVHYGFYNSVDISAEQNAIKDLKETQA